jgi:hypothetical protein
MAYKGTMQSLTSVILTVRNKRIKHYDLFLIILRNVVLFYILYCSRYFSVSRVAQSA